MVETGLAKAQEAEEPDVPVPQTSILMATAIAGGLIGAAIVLVWEPGWSDTQKRLADSGPFVLWVALTVAQAMLWAAALPWLVVTLLRQALAQPHLDGGEAYVATELLGELEELRQPRERR